MVIQPVCHHPSLPTKVVMKFTLKSYRLNFILASSLPNSSFRYLQQFHFVTLSSTLTLTQHQMSNVLFKYKIFSPNPKYSYQTPNILTKYQIFLSKKEIFSPNTKYSQQIGNILSKWQIFWAKRKYTHRWRKRRK